MNANVPSIEQLKEMALPAPVSYAPHTWGWWVLLGLLIGAVLLFGARRYWQWRRDRYRREALVRLAQLQQRGNDLSALRELAEVLKRVALSMPTSPLVGARLAREERLRGLPEGPQRLLRGQASLLQDPSALGGKDWQAFLQRHIKQPLPDDFGQQLSLLAYAPDAVLLALPNEQRQRLFMTCKTWVEHHRVAV
ncbi:DUF4381 domain-containing protein [Pseudomonas sp. NPDC089569]|uniref:DUF4381 domain-containing protein n=1 Tax=Pseudomonas sp. NPDC089569 TaxID=3390722 RepID=UPI003D056D2C